MLHESTAVKIVLSQIVELYSIASSGNLLVS